MVYLFIRVAGELARRIWPNTASKLAGYTRKLHQEID